MTQTKVKKTKDVLKNLREEDILNSLENAISLYKTKEIKDLQEKTSVVKKDKQTKQAVKKVEKKEVKKASVKPIKKIEKEVEFEQKAIKNKIVKNSVKKVSKKSRVGIFKKVTNGVQAGRDYLFFYRTELITFSLAFVMVMAVSYSSYIAYAYMSTGNTDIVARVSSHMILPSGETPKVYIIQSDKSEIFNNPLFSGIQLGDNVLSYPEAGKVIIYRAKEDKIVNVVNTSQ